MWRKRNLVHCWWECCAATVESSMEISQKIKKGSFEPVIPLLGIYPKEPKTLILKNISTPMFIALLFTIAKIWKQPKCSSVDEWIKQLWDIYIMKYYSAIKKENFTFCYSMDEPGEHYAKRNKAIRKRQIPYDFTLIWNLMNKLNQQSKQRQSHSWRA